MSCDCLDPKADFAQASCGTSMVSCWKQKRTTNVWTSTWAMAISTCTTVTVSRLQAALVFRCFYRLLTFFGSRKRSLSIVAWSPRDADAHSRLRRWKFLRWRHQLCYNSPSTSSFNLTENLFFRDVETPTRRMSSAADGPWKFGSYNALHTPDLVQLIFIYYIIYTYIYTHISTRGHREPETARKREGARERQGTNISPQINLPAWRLCAKQYRKAGAESFALLGCSLNPLDPFWLSRPEVEATRSSISMGTLSRRARSVGRGNHCQCRVFCTD